MASLLLLPALCVMFLSPSATEKPSSVPMTYSAETDLQGKMFSVNKGGQVILRSDRLASLSSFTVCLRHISESFEEQHFFSLKLGSQYSISLTSTGFRALSLTGGGESRPFSSFFAPRVFVNGPWTVLCATWESGGGMAQVLWNGMPSVRKGMWQNQVFSGQPLLTVSGFVGQITDVHVWDYVLSTTDLTNFCKGFMEEGTVLSWRRAQYSTYGYVVLEQVQVFPGALPCKPWERCWRKEMKLKSTGWEQQAEGRGDEEGRRGNNQIRGSVL